MRLEAGRFKAGNRWHHGSRPGRDHDAFRPETTDALDLDRVGSDETRFAELHVHPHRSEALRVVVVRDRLPRGLHP